MAHKNTIKFKNSQNIIGFLKWDKYSDDNVGIVVRYDKKNYNYGKQINLPVDVIKKLAKVI